MSGFTKLLFYLLLVGGLGSFLGYQSRLSSLKPKEILDSNKDFDPQESSEASVNLKVPTSEREALRSFSPQTPIIHEPISLPQKIDPQYLKSQMGTNFKESLEDSKKAREFFAELSTCLLSMETNLDLKIDCYRQAKELKNKFPELNFVFAQIDSQLPDKIKKASQNLNSNTPIAPSYICYSLGSGNAYFELQINPSSSAQNLYNIYLLKSKVRKAQIKAQMGEGTQGSSSTDFFSNDFQLQINLEENPISPNAHPYAHRSLLSLANFSNASIQLGPEDMDCEDL